METETAKIPKTAAELADIRIHRLLVKVKRLQCVRDGLNKRLAQERAAFAAHARHDADIIRLYKTRAERAEHGLLRATAQPDKDREELRRLRESLTNMARAEL